MNVLPVLQAVFLGGLVNPNIQRERNCNVSRFGPGVYDIEWPNGPVGVDGKDLSIAWTVDGPLNAYAVKFTAVTDRQVRVTIFDVGANQPTDSFILSVLLSRVLGAGA